MPLLFVNDILFRRVSFNQNLYRREGELFNFWYIVRGILVKKFIWEKRKINKREKNNTRAPARHFFLIRDLDEEDYSRVLETWNVGSRRFELEVGGLLFKLVVQKISHFYRKRKANSLELGPRLSIQRPTLNLNLNISIVSLLRDGLFDSNPAH